MKRIGCDCDGILADFSLAFSTILRELHGTKIPIVTDPEVQNWDWDKWLPLSKEEVDQGWDVIHSNPEFWERLHLTIDLPIWERFINEIGKNPQLDTYFLTTRKNTGQVSAAQQTWRWLYDMGWPHPHVIADKEKGAICNTLRIEYMIDDSGRNCLDIVEKSPNTKIYMLDCLHNQKIEHSKIRRIYSVNEYIDDILAGK
jgi:hypothetical protein